ncbi:MAG TPA: hypothetical protein GXZ47_10565 [Treponema sp.]|nr:hypothetical protein [Treponema sp.]
MRRLLFIIIISSISTYVVAERIVVAPVHIINEQESTTKKKNNSHNDITIALKQLDGANILGFESVGLLDINPPASFLDAIRLGNELGTDYLLYGYIKTTDYSWAIELKLLDVNDSRVKHIFYASDDKTKYDRMISDVAEKIVLYIMDKFHVSIEGISKDSREMLFNIPFSIGYWTYTSGIWNSTITGTGSATIGLEFIPVDRLFLFHGDVWFLSFGLMLNFRYGMGDPSHYEASIHSVTVELPVALYRQWNPRSTLFFGIVPMYTMDFMTYAPRNSGSESFFESAMGIKLRPGIRFRAFQKMDMTFTVDFGLRFYDPLQPSIEPSLGIVYNLSKKKWRE